MIAGTMVALPSAANAQHHWHGGGGPWHGGHGGWGWGGFGLSFGTGLALGAAPYYYGGPYAYDYGGPYAYAGDCVMRKRWVIDGYGHRVWRWTRVCY
jgi:hypothetical protein